MSGRPASLIGIVREVQDLQEGEVYIGRGTQGGIPKSFWHNMYVIDRAPGGLTRDQVIAAFREKIRRSPELQARIGERKDYGTNDGENGIFKITVPKPTNF